MDSIGPALRAAVPVLKGAGIDGAARDARVLMAHVLCVAPTRLMLLEGDALTADQTARFRALIARRAAREPVSHLIGKRAFYGRDFIVTPKVLDPRPETETLIAAALDVPFTRVLDLGTGSGCIAVTLLAERAGTHGVATDISDSALSVAKRNAQVHGVADRLTLTRSDWFDTVAGRFDLIVSNPPYIAAEEMPDLAPELTHEPHMALSDGADGLSAYRAICRGLTQHMAPGARVMVEIGWTQGQAVSSLFKAAGLARVEILPDLDGRDRVVCAIAA